MRDNETPVETEKLGVDEVVEKLSVKKDRTLTGIWRAIVIIFGTIVVLLGINTVFNLRFFQLPAQSIYRRDIKTFVIGNDDNFRSRKSLL